MPSKLDDNTLSRYRKFPHEVEVDKLCPDFRESLHDLAQHVPEFGLWTESILSPEGEEVMVETEPSKRAQEEILALFYKDTQLKELLTARRIKGNLNAMVASIRSRIRQLEESFLWNTRRRFFEESERARVEDERQSYAKGEKRFYQPRLACASFVSSSNDRFRGSTPNFAKMIQRVMSDPTNRMIITDDKEARSPEIVQDMIIDPQLLTDRQLENLGGQMPRRRLSRVERLEFKDEAIDRIKGELPVLREIGDWDQRDRFGRYRMYASRDGEVIGITNVKKGRPTIYKTKLRDAPRRKEHIETGYPSESRSLLGIISMIEDVERRLSEEWKQLKRPEELAEAKAAIAEAVEQLKKVRDEDKLEAKKVLEDAMSMGTTYCKTVKEPGKPEHKEWKIKLNPGAKRSQINKALRKLRKRLNRSIPNISRYVGNDRVLIEQEYARHQNLPFERLLKHMEEKRRPIQAEDHRQRLLPHQKEGVQERLNKWQRRFLAPVGKGPYLEPYNSFCERVNGAIERTQSVLKQENCSLAKLKEGLAELHSVLQLYAIWNRWEDLYDQHLGNDNKPMYINFATDLKTLRTQIGASIQTDCTQDAYTDFLRNTEEAINLCYEGKHAMKIKDFTAAKSIRLALKRQMREVDIKAQLT